MADRPILFSGEMVRAILDGGRKTQTRRVVKPQPLGNFYLSGDSLIDAPEGQLMNTRIRCPYGTPGDKLWVREKFITGWDAPDGDLQEYDEDGNELPEKVWYAADDNGEGFTWLGDDGELLHNIPWKPSIHMPRWAGRITLEVTEVRVERVQEISAEDALAEGLVQTTRFGAPAFGCNGWVMDDYMNQPVPVFHTLWDSINAKRGFGCEQNPWVWAITFRRITDGNRGD